ncbi:hypothetical protein ABEF95_014896 [Exophiala dermatitidis]
MASVFEGFMSSRRRASRARSASEKKLHSRWGDAAITAPNGGWSQRQADEDDAGHSVHGSPDSQKTLVNGSPDPGEYESDKATAHTAGLPKPATSQKERSALVITIPLPWSRKTHRRSLSADHLRDKDDDNGESVRRVVKEEVRRPDTAHIDNEEEPSWPLRSTPSTSRYHLPTGSSLYEGPRTPFVRVAFPDKDVVPPRLPQLQTGVPPAKSQPASGVSVLTPVNETFDGRSESNNATPIWTTPIAQIAASGISVVHDDEEFNPATSAGAAATSRLDFYHLPKTPRDLPPSLLASPNDSSGSDVDRISAQRNPRASSRPQSRGPGIGELAYQRNSSRSADERRSASRGGAPAATRRYRSASREQQAGRGSDSRAESVESAGRRAISRDRVGPRGGNSTTISREVSRDPATRSRPADWQESLERPAIPRKESSYHGSRNASREPDGRSRSFLESDASGTVANGPEASSLSGRYDPAVTPGSGSPSGSGGKSGRRAAATSSKPSSGRDTTSRRRSPSPEKIRITRRAHSREAYSTSNHHRLQRASSPPGSRSHGRTAPGALTPRRLSDDSASGSGRRAVSVDPVRRPTVGPRDDIVIHWASTRPLAARNSSASSPNSSSGSSSFIDDAVDVNVDHHHTPIGPADNDDISTDIDSEAEVHVGADESYFQSRKGWHGAAGMKGAESKGFYGDVAQDYRAIARDVEADKPLVGYDRPPLSAGISIVSMVVNKKDRAKDRHRTMDAQREKEKSAEKEREKVPAVFYGGPDLVPSHEELWG